VKLLYNQHKNRWTQPSTTDISKALVSVISSFPRVFIIIDALDECQVNNGYRSRFQTEISNLQAECHANIFVTSRSIPEITEKFKGSISLKIHADEEDIRRYLNGYMLRLPAFVGRNPELQEEIKTKIVEVVDGMYVPFCTLIKIC
jgi:hypothetical protein